MRKWLLASVFVIAAVSSGGQKTAFPKVVKGKTLYAKHDFRGKKAPSLVVEKWLPRSAPQPTRGKVVVVDFWATWCGPCVALIPEMNAWAKKFSKDVVFIGISDEPAATVAAFMKKKPMHYNVAVDTKGRTKRALGVEGIPHVMIIDRKGIVRWQGFPGSKEDPLTESVIRQVVAASKR